MTKSDAIEDVGPAHTASLYGHLHAEERLLQDAQSGRLPHAWLITGPEGIGKATLAFRFARFLLAGYGRPKQEDAGGGLFGDGLPEDLSDNLYVPPEHPVFRRIAAGSHADLKLVAPSANDQGKMRADIVVDDVRALLPFFGMSASEGGWRIAIVDGAEKMNRNAANALLKILEEPPHDSLILLVSHAPGQLLPTIRSRCQQLRLSPLGPEDFAAVLTEQDILLNPAQTELVNVLCEGRPGAALRLLAGDGLDLYEGLITAMTGLPKLNLKAVDQLAGLLGRNDGEASITLLAELWQGVLSRLVAIRASGRSLDTLPSTEKQLGEALSSRGALDQWLALWDKVGQFLRQTDGLHLDPRQMLIAALDETAKVVR